MALKKWEVASYDRQTVREIAQQTGLPAAAAALLQSRGCKTAQEAADLINGAPLSDPLLLKDMDKAVERINRAIEEFEKSRFMAIMMRMV